MWHFILVPQQLHTLWTSKNAAEVHDALQNLVSALLLARKKITEPENEEVNEDSEILLVELLIEST